MESCQGRRLTSLTSRSIQQENGGVDLPIGIRAGVLSQACEGLEADAMMRRRKGGPA
jgi:hypothetical protein